jgi:hypothetical protein
LSSYLAILVGYLYAWSPGAITLALILLSAVCAFVGRVFRSRANLTFRPWSPADSGILAATGSLLVAFSAIPALNVGKLTSQGYAYTWLYGFDFLYRADVIQAMTTHMPPDWSWMTGIPLRMYLVGYSLPAFAYAATGKSVAIHPVLLVTTLFCAFLFLASLYLFLRTLFSETAVLLSTLCVVLIGYSYYWLYEAAAFVFFKPGFRLFGSISTVSHHLQRTILVEPQAALATALLFAVLTALALSRFRLNSTLLAVFVGLCLGIGFGMEAMQGLLAAAWFFLFYFLRIVLRKTSREELFPFLAALIVCSTISASFFVLGMYQRSTSHLAPISFNPWIAEFGLPYFLVDLGPLFVLGIWGMVRWWRGSRDEFGWPFLLLAAITLIQVLLIFQKPPARMADRLLPVALVPFVAYILRDAWTIRLSRRAMFITAVVAVIAVPTFFTDIGSTSNVNNSYDTRYVRPEDMKACQWITRNLPESAVIQGSYDYFAGPERGLYLSLIASFAHRPQVLGWTTNAAYVVDNGFPIAKERRADITRMLSASGTSSVLDVVHKYSIDYIYVGPFERQQFPTFLPLLLSAPASFHEVYSQNGVVLFQPIDH